MNQGSAAQNLVNNETIPQVGKPFGFKDKIGYMLGDFGSDLSFMLVTAFLMVYYTDVFGISAAAVGTLFLVARLWDAVTDVLWARFIDSRNTSPAGKFRPWILRMSLPLVVSTVLMFVYIPGMSEGFYLAYAYVTYILWGMLYTTVNIPYGSMASVISDDAVHRTQLSGWRTVGAISAVLIINVVLPLVLFVDNQISSNRMIMTAIVLAILALACYIGCFKMTTERIVNPTIEKGKTNSLGKVLLSLVKNRPFIAIITSSILFMTSGLLAGTINVYLFKDFFGMTSLMSIFGLMQPILVYLLLPTLKPLVKRFGKKETAVAGVLLAACAYIILYFIPNITVTTFMVLVAIGSIGIVLYNLTLWAFITDATDYQEFLTGSRDDATVYAIFTFCRKIGQAIAGGLSGYVLFYIGYQSGISVQPDEVKDGIYMIATLVPGGFYFLMFLILAFIYPLSKKRTDELAIDLAKKREGRQ